MAPSPPFWRTCFKFPPQVGGFSFEVLSFNGRRRFGEAQTPIWGGVYLHTNRWLLKWNFRPLIRGQNGFPKGPDRGKITLSSTFTILTVSLFLSNRISCFQCAVSPNHPESGPQARIRETLMGWYSQPSYSHHTFISPYNFPFSYNSLHPRKY